MSVSAQLNVRLDKELKTAGDLALSDAGLSPSKLVRLVWAKVASNDGLHELLAMLGDNATRRQEVIEKPTADSETPKIARGAQLFDEGLRRLGITQPHATSYEVPANWKAVREEVIAERLAERGII